MNNNLHAVILGFNKYQQKPNFNDLNFAEKDANDLYELLINPYYGNCPPENITLITGNKIRMKLEEDISKYPENIIELTKSDETPQSLSYNDIQTILYIKAVKDRTPEDTVIVYYSGHGFIAGPDEYTYLATQDTLLLNINNNPSSGISMEYLHNTIFKKTKAKFGIFLLDCCNSGAFCLDYKKNGDYIEKQLIESKFFSSGKVALVSSPRGITSRESAQFKNGIFTYHLLNGLKGEAKEKNGEVTFASLTAYVQHMSPGVQPPIMYGEATRIVLFSPQNGKSNPQSIFHIIENNFPQNRSTNDRFLPLINPLEKRIKFAEDVIQCIKIIGNGDQKSLGNQVLTSIRCALDAEYVFILRIDNDDEDQKQMITKYESDLQCKGTNLSDYREKIANNLYKTMIQNKNFFYSSKFGFVVQFSEQKNQKNDLVIVPLRLEYPREFIIICGIEPSKLEYGEIIGRTLTSLYFGTKELTDFDLYNIEAQIWDDIKREFGRVPYNIYNLQFNNFKNKLSKIQFYFEPTIFVSGNDFEIDSWEALARDPRTQLAPFDLFNSAELWGTEFITELDITFLNKAVATYKEFWERDRDHQKYDQISVNVYPETLFRTAYKDALKRILHTKGNQLLREKLVLEISEKRPLPKQKNISDSLVKDFDPVEYFAQKIKEYKDNLQTNFAIDDFGVGQSSSERLAKLQLSHVKIDKDVLRHPFPECTINYVIDISRKNHPQSLVKIVIEGFDEHSKIRFNSLCDIGLMYFQGHHIRKASPNLLDFSNDERNVIARQLGLEENT